ncbi:hypothetical protein [Williamsia deligens]|uniref:Uncharacterized protein n=1 Tax=Williamsia deligens TaxID=321325 RepID=A0ABW3GBN1_9NOCA|nr:hypothetical protein [Williamsia deligens]MCP2195157.1 hypothetical protein [Williamsia deligens]
MTVDPDAIDPRATDAVPADLVPDKPVPEGAEADVIEQNQVVEIDDEDYPHASEADED